ncbi:TRAP transporter large permease [Photobacterium makurazakiensis]|uniref:TRAP transporter large permease n=1 Tax=Photobacterium makurazakiensis TaxID=2910234 RepID=UPI003D0F7CFE
MTTTMLITMIVLLLLGFPMMITLMAATLIGFYFQFLGFSNSHFMIQQMLAGIKPASLIAIPMFILAADIMSKGRSAERLIDMVMVYIGHYKGGLAVSTATACTLFGAVSGSTQATVVAVGSPLRPKLMSNGYKDSFSLSLIISSSSIALLIPPSIGMIIYGGISQTSISELFISGIVPGLLILVLFSLYSIFFAVKNDVPTLEKATWSEKWQVTKAALWPLGFPLIIVCGIYGGIFSPTEAASTCVLYALILEVVVFKAVGKKEILEVAKSTGLITAVVFILVAAGSAFSWVISFAQIPQTIMAGLGLDQANEFQLLMAISIAFFVACMFVDSIVVILILVPIFLPEIERLELDKVLVGILITLQVAIGAVTPPFGCNIFTAVAVFKRPYIEVVKGLLPFVVILLTVVGLLITYPQIALFLRDLAKN